MSRDEACNAPDALKLVEKRVSVVLLNLDYLSLLSLLAPPTTRCGEFATEERVVHLLTRLREEGASEGGGREGGGRGGGGRGGGGVLEETDEHFQVVVQRLLVGQGVLS